MREQPGLSIVIPAYNEERRLPRTLEQLRDYRQRFPGDFEIIVANDGSADGTAALVRGLAVAMPELRLVDLPHRGKGSAVRGGMLAATQPRVILCDADLSMPADQLDRFVRSLESGIQVAVGSRELPDSQRYEEPARRHFMGRVFNLLVRILLVPGLNDTQAGFKGFTREAARDLFALGRLDGFSFDAEILFLARKRHYRIAEVPIDWYFNTDSRVRAVTDTLNMSVDLLRIRYYDLRGAYKRPKQTPSNG